MAPRSDSSAWRSCGGTLGVSSQGISWSRPTAAVWCDFRGSGFPPGPRLLWAVTGPAFEPVQPCSPPARRRAPRAGNGPAFPPSGTGCAWSPRAAEHAGPRSRGRWQPPQRLAVDGAELTLDVPPTSSPENRTMPGAEERNWGRTPTSSTCALTIAAMELQQCHSVQVFCHRCPHATLGWLSVIECGEGPTVMATRLRKRGRKQALHEVNERRVALGEAPLANGRNIPVYIRKTFPAGPTCEWTCWKCKAKTVVATRELVMALSAGCTTVVPMPRGRAPAGVVPRSCHKGVTRGVSPRQSAFVEHRL